MQKRSRPVLVAVAALALAALLLYVASAGQAPLRAALGLATTRSAQYAGSAQCSGCHAKEYEAWRRSHHALAMQEANAQSVLGDFDGARYAQAGVTSTFFQRDGRFYVNTDGPDGRLGDFRIAYTFGVAPLQQFLIALPGGRLQALGIAWDARPAEQGGQRWFHLYPDQDLKAGDPLHWTGFEQTWNFQCADCHSTNLQKNYDAATRSYRTRWSELSVGCEACHGPASAHLQWAQRPLLLRRFEHSKGLDVLLDERRGVRWTTPPGRVSAARSEPRASDREIQACASCHSRRGQFSDEQPRRFLDAYRPALLEAGLYHADGQMRDEVYNYGPFLQSRMHAAGVTCSDCHEPHGATLRAQGKALCAQCHVPARFDTPDHHRHAPNSAGAQCTVCHMPQATYMQVDARHDHSLRIPRPDLSAELGTPDPCAACHADKPADWTARAFREWLPQPKGGGEIQARAFQMHETGAPAAEAELLRIAEDRRLPGILRASAIQRLSAYARPRPLAVLESALADADPLLRMAAAQSLAGRAVKDRARLLAPLLSDPQRIVRMEAARVLAGEAEAQLDAQSREAMQHAAAEYLSALRFNSDRPEAQVSIGSWLAARGDLQGGLAAYREALALAPGFVPAAVNLADLHRIAGDEAGAESVLRQALARAAMSADLHHALGLSLVRQRRHAEALTELAAAASLDPGNRRYAEVYAIALRDRPPASGPVPASVRPGGDR